MQRGIVGAIVAVAVCTIFTHSAAAQEDHLKCYKVKDPVRLRGPNPSWLDLDGPQFGSEQCKIVGGFRMFCVPVTKTVTAAIERKVIPGGWQPYDPNPVPGPDVLAQDKLCYKIKCANNAVPNPLDPRSVFDQFGNREVSRWQPFMLCGPAEKGVRFQIPLMDATQEVPPNASTAVGSCEGILEGSTLTMTCVHDVVAPTGAHVHAGAAGVNGPIEFPFPSPVSPMTASWSMSIGQIGLLTTNALYVNVHSSNCGTCGGGEIRGQWEQAP